MKDPIARIRQAQMRGISIRRMSEESGVAYTTIQSWIARGSPTSFAQIMKVLKAIKEMT